MEGAKCFGLFVMMFLAVCIVVLNTPHFVHIGILNVGVYSVPTNGSYSEDISGVQSVRSFRKKYQDTVHLAAVSCGRCVEESLVMLKSAVFFTHGPLHIHVFTEKKLKAMFSRQLLRWANSYGKELKYTIYDLKFPSKEWRNLFHACASQRLFFPELLADIEAVIYVDTDVIFLRPLNDLWAILHQFNRTQLAAVGPNSGSKFYRTQAQFPFVPPNGLNSGVILMDLAKMRQAKWLSHMVEYYNKWKSKLVMGDQDLINIFFHYHPEMFYDLSCEWNYRTEYCSAGKNTNVCLPIIKNEISLVHGCRGAFHGKKAASFKALYDVFKEYRYETENGRKLLLSVKSRMKNLPSSVWCSHVASDFIRQIEYHVNHKRKTT